VKERTVTIESHGKDRYGRLLASVEVGQDDVAHRLVADGMAWHYEKYDHNKRMREAEQSARAARNGLRVDGNAVPPWDWRKERQHRKESVKP